jgi:hypothetical protein
MSFNSIIRRSLIRIAITAVFACIILSWPLIGHWQASGSSPEPANGPHPDVVCAECHREIFERYEQSSMARGGGLAVDGLIPGSFRHKLSGVSYNVFLRDGSAWMSYSRPATDPKGALAGERRLEFYIGSGHRGRTYLYQVGSQWFELPINFYTRRTTWDMAPAFDNVANMPAPLPVDPNCLHCHSTAGQPSLATAKNRFATVPFLQAGIGCSACHGDPSAHLAQHGHGPITNPGKLPPAQRDSACIQCHLEGDAVVYRPGHSLAKFIPEDNLSDTAVYFVRTSQQTGGARATSQYEALLHSACKRATGDKLTCTTCHDPHFDPPAAERIEYYRARCLSCHTNPKIANHHTEQPDCATCHMPSRNTVDISHEQVTDHDIEARPASHAGEASAGPAHDVLVPVGNFAAGDREYGLAYAQLAQRGLPGASESALRLLSKAAQSGASDEELNVRLGYLNQVAGNIAQARAFYTKTLEADPYEPTALANLAVIDASSGHLPEAIRLLERLTAADPSQTAAGINLAFILCRTNRAGDALTLLRQLEAINPDDPQLRAFLHSGNYAGQHCSLPN